MLKDDRLTLLPKEKAMLRSQPLPPLKGAAARVYAYLCYQEVAGHKATRGEVNQVLGRINLNDALRTIAILNSALSETSPASHTVNPRFQAQLETTLFDRKWRELICQSRWGDGPSHFIIFHRQQTLFLTDLALENCPLQGGSSWNEEGRYLFGIACLMVSDLLSDGDSVDLKNPPSGGRPRHTARHLTEPERWKAIVDVLVTLDFDADSHDRNGIARAQRLWVDIPTSQELRQRAGKEWVDWDSAFIQSYGVSIQEFLTTTFAIWLYTALPVLDSATDLNHLIFDPHAILQHTNLSSGKIKAVLNLLSRPVAELKAQLPMMSRHRPGWDLTALKRSPLITLEDGRVLVFDQTLLRKASTEGVYWLIQDAMPDERSFGNMFGHVYDEYIKAVLRSIVPNDVPPVLPRYHSNPYFKVKGKEEVSDGLINCGSVAVLIEVKGSLLTTRAKYSGNGQALKREIDAKFALATGARQLADSIRRISHGDKPNVRGYNSQTIQRIIPILVSYDTAPGTLHLQNYINQVFKERLGNVSPIRVGRLIVASTLEMEMLETASHIEPLCKILMRYEKDKAGVPLQMFLVGNYLNEIDNADVTIRNAFGDSAEKLANLFGRTLNEG